MPSGPVLLPSTPPFPPLVLRCSSGRQPVGVQLKVASASLIDPVSMGALYVAKGITDPSFELRVLRDYSNDVDVQLLFFRIRELTKPISIRYAIGGKEIRVELPEAPTQGGRFTYMGLGSIRVEGPFRSGMVFPVTMECTDEITFSGSILRGHDTDCRAAFEFARFGSSVDLVLQR